MANKRTNDTRAARALAAIVAYRAYDNGGHDEGEDEADLRDLLADLMHYAGRCDQNDGPDYFDRQLASARTHYEKER